MPFAASQDRRIRPMDVILLNAIAAGPQDIHGWTSVGNQTLADTLRVSKVWVIEAMKRLGDAGWVESRRRRDPETGADLPSERRINWNNTLPGEETSLTPGVNDVDPLDESAEGTLLPDAFPTGDLLAAAAADPRYAKLPLNHVAADFRRKYCDGVTRRKSWRAAWDRWLRTAHKDYPDDDRPHPVGTGHAARVRTNASRLAEAAAQHALRRPN